MQVKIETPKILTSAVEIMSELVTEVKLKFNDSGLSVTAMDPANVAMIRIRIPKSAFSQFEVGEESLGVNLDDLKKILKRASNASSLVLKKVENTLDLEINDKVNRKFSLALIELDSEDKNIPNLEYAAEIELNSTDFVDSIEDCAVVDDACSFIVEEGKFILESKNLNSSRAEFSGDEATIKAENCKSRYSLEYLKKFIKATKLCKKTKIKFATNHPLRLDFQGDNFEINFILAPRVETED